jgi:hypothetical protein
MERNDDPQLWDLLRHSKTPEPSPFFARNVIRAVRAQPATADGVATWFQLRRLIPSFSALAAIVIAVFTLLPLHRSRPVRSAEQSTPVEAADAELATDFDVLSGDDDSDDSPLL